LIEREATFTIVTVQDELKGNLQCIYLQVIPKRNNVFEFSIGSQSFIIYGNQWVCKSGERVVRKYRGLSIEL
jgi:hypothetical protein